MASMSAPVAARRADSSTMAPSPIVTVRLSTTSTRRSPATALAPARAASMVADSSPDRWMDTTESQPRSASFR